MLVLAVLTLYTSDPAAGAVRALVERMKATGHLVFLKPLDQMPTKPKQPAPTVRVASGLRQALKDLPLN